MSQKPALPASANSNFASLVGLATTALAVFAVIHFDISDSVDALVLLCVAYTVPIALYDVFVRKVHRNPSAGLNWDAPPRADFSRIVCKLVGLAAIVGLVVGLHGMFRLMNVTYALISLKILLSVLPWAIPMCIAYFAFIDGRMRSPEDGYWHLGAWLLGRNPTPDRAKLRTLFMGWAVKGFFLPLMAVFLVLRLNGMDGMVADWHAGGVRAVVAMTGFFIVLDLVIGTVGYVMTCRLFDAHIRSVNGFLMGWMITLACYPPFNSVVLGQVFKYNTSRNWEDVIDQYPSLVVIWCGAILLTYFIWLWATANFGIRFSNLTHRGIITSGPYRFTKHPDYVSKSCFFWLTAAPFLTAFGTWEAIAATFAMVVTNGIYYGRAVWEEKHLSEDPVYVEYALAMNRNSIFRPVARVLPFLIYRAPDGRTGLENEAVAPSGHPAE